MKQHALTVILFAGLAALLVMNAPSAQSETEAADSEKRLRHVVMFKYKADATEEQINRVAEEFSNLPDKIDSIHDYEWGVNNSPEDHAQGYTHCFLVTFKDEAGRAEYLPHPAHKAFIQVLLPVLDEVHVLDYWAQN